MSQKYDQPEKNLAREKLIKNAIKLLTTNRSKSFLANEKSVKKMIIHFCSLINQYLSTKQTSLPQDFTKNILENWESISQSKYFSKEASHLKVLYLAGPEPSKDLETLLKYGIKSHNIWAIEGDNKTFNEAIEDLKIKRKYIKVHKGSLKSFFECYPEQFDIVYYDACTPLSSSKYNPLNVLEELFAKRRLTELAILITNFSEPDNKLYEEWGKILGSWYASRYDDVPSSTHNYHFSDIPDRISNFNTYSKFISNRIPEYYSDFIPKFISSLAAEIIPFIKITNFESINSKLFSNYKAEDFTNNNIEVNGEFNLENLITTIPHHILSPESYPLLNWANLSIENLPNNNAMFKFIKDNKVYNAILAGTQLKAYEESNSGFSTSIEKICSNQLMNILNNIDFFDRHLPLTTDIPMKNLITELIIGQYSFPYIANSEIHYSLKYKASGKSTWMYSDLFVFDQCRYLYDLLPSIELLKAYFKDNIELQIIIRSCIDCILRKHSSLNRQLFIGGFIEPLYDNQFGHATLNNRITLNNKYKLIKTTKLHKNFIRL